MHEFINTDDSKLIDNFQNLKKLKIPFSFFCTFILITFFLTACSTTKDDIKKENTKMEVFYQDLADRLRAEGINVMGTGENASVVIRGIQTITGDPRPIFVVDGLNMGRDYNVVNNGINVNDIKRVKVLRGKSETALYGEAGNNGVILLTMKK